MLDAVNAFLRVTQPKVDEVIKVRLAALETDVLPLIRTSLSALRERELSIGGHLRSTARHLVQAGLFDRRALRDAEHCDAIRHDLAEESELHLRTLAAAEFLTPSARLSFVLVRPDGQK